MNPLYTIWFWLLLISIILLIVAAIIFEIHISNQTMSPWWIWIIFGLGITSFIASIIIYQLTYSYPKDIKVCDYKRTTYVVSEPLSFASIY